MPIQNSISALPTVNTAVIGTGTAFSNLPYASLAGSPVGGTSNLASRDANGNTAFNNFFANVTENSTFSTITLTAASTGVQNFSGSSGGSTVVLPNATTLTDGWQYFFNDNVSGNIIVQTNGGGSLLTMVGGSAVHIFLIDSSTSTGQWDYQWLMPPSAVYGTLGLTVTGNVTASTSVSAPELLVTGSSSGTVSVLPQAAAGTYNFNLPTTAGTAGQSLVSGGGGSSPMTWGASAAFTWSVVTASTQAMISGFGYISNASSGGVIYSLPVTSSVGDVIRVSGIAGASGWTIAQISGESIQIGVRITTPGPIGFLRSTSNTDSIELLCIVTNTTWVAISWVGNITVS